MRAFAMIWQPAAHLIEIAIVAWFLLVLATIGWQLASGRIWITGMLVHRGDGRLRFHRVQMLAVSLLFAAGYVITALGKGPGSAMPDISTPMLALLIGSHLAYLGGKALG
jgi:hypothetical protein